MIAIRPSRLTRRVPFACSSGYVGIDIGSHAIKVAQVARRGQSWRLVSARAFRHVEPLSWDVPARCAAQIVESLDHIWDSSRRWLADDAACLLPLSAMTLRNLCLPAGSPSEQRAMIGAELADDTGLDPDDWSLAWWPDETGAGEPGTESLSILGVSQELAESVLEALLTRGLACTLMPGLPFVLAAAVSSDARMSAHTPIGVLDWGYHSALLTVVAQGRPAFTRMLRDCGFHHVINTVANGLNLEPRDVARLICGFNRPVYAPSDHPARRTVLDELLDAAVARLGEEMLRTTSFLQQQRPWLAPQRYVVCGGGGTLRGGVGRLGEIVQTPVSLWNGPFDSHQVTGLIPPLCLMAQAISLSLMRWGPS